MDGAKGSALEWALALLRAPGERHALRQKPLPAGMDVLLGIAAGAMPEALAAATATFGEPAERLREAAQFYAREVLFFPQADAYRVLGVSAGAGGEQIKAHHRLLQLWLHPDRPHSEEDAVFAARVNTAWNRLRTPDHRRLYDEALRQQRPPELFDSSGTLRRVSTWVPAVEMEPPEARWRRRVPVLVLLGLCAVLLLVVVLREEPALEPQAGVVSVEAAGELAVPAALLSPVATPPQRATRKPARSAHEDAAAALAVAKPAPRPVAMPPAAAATSPSAAPRLAEEPALAAMPTATAIAAATLPPPARRGDLPARGVAVAQAAAQPAAVPVSAPAPEPPPVAAVDAPAPDFNRMQQARQTGEQLLRFLQATDRRPPPIWNNPGIQTNAELVRQALRGNGRVRWVSPRWAIGHETAELTSGVAGTGQLSARLRWREGVWLVTDVNLERD